MKVGLIDIDSKIPNLALMKISAHHKNLGNQVDLIGELEAPHYDRVYASQVFTYTNCPNLPLNTDIGGSGYDLKKNLPHYMEHLMPDYLLYPNVDYSMGFTTRGCLRACPFCIVPQKEGRIRFNADITEFWNPEHRKLILLDNNIFALSGQFERIGEQILRKELRVDFNQGLDIRLLTDAYARLLKQLKPLKQWRFAFDSLDQEKAFRKGAELLLANKIPRHLISVYVLAGFNESLEDTMKRIKIICGEYKFDPFLMLYQDNGGLECSNRRFKSLRTDMNTPSWKKWKNFARWVNHKAIFNSVPWEEYKA